VIDYYLTPCEQSISYSMTSSSYISMRWRWCQVCTRTIRQVLYLMRNDYRNSSTY